MPVQWCTKKTSVEDQDLFFMSTVLLSHRFLFNNQHFRNRKLLCALTYQTCSTWRPLTSYCWMATKGSHFELILEIQAAAAECLQVPLCFGGDELKVLWYLLNLFWYVHLVDSFYDVPSPTMLFLLFTRYFFSHGNKFAILLFVCLRE